MKKVILLLMLSSAIVADNSYEIYLDSRTDKPDSGDPDLEGIGYGGRAILFEDKLMLDLSFGRNIEQKGALAEVDLIPGFPVPVYDSDNGESTIIKGEYYILGDLKSGAIGAIAGYRKYQIDASIPAFQFSQEIELKSTDLGFVYRKDTGLGINYAYGAYRSRLKFDGGDEQNINVPFIEAGYTFANGINIRAFYSNGSNDSFDTIHLSLGYRF